MLLHENENEYDTADCDRSVGRKPARVFKKKKKESAYANFKEYGSGDAFTEIILTKCKSGLDLWSAQLSLAPRQQKSVA
jgi:hypothetical protein